MSCCALAYDTKVLHLQTQVSAPNHGSILQNMVISLSKQNVDLTQEVIHF